MILRWRLNMYFEYRNLTTLPPPGLDQSAA